MQELEYESYKIDLDLWWKPGIKPQDKFEYYSYILCYVDDILYTHHNPDDMLNNLTGFAPLKAALLIVPSCNLVKS